MRLVHTTIVTAVVAFVGGLASPTDASLTGFAVNKCLAGKLKAQGKGAAAETSCHAKDAAKPDPAKLAACLAKAHGKVTGAFQKLDAKYPGGCATANGDGLGRADDAESFGGQVRDDVGDALGKCDGPKQKCVGKYVAAVLGCYAKAANKGGVVDAGCLAKASAKLANGVNGCLDKAAAAGGCTHAGSQEAALRADADMFADAQGCLLDPGAGGCGPVACPSTVEFAPDGDADATRVDTGWQWIGHDRPFPTGSLLSVAVLGPSGSDCLFAGPIANFGAGAGAIDNQRCTGNTSVTCTNAPGGTGGPCTGLGTCEFFAGPPLPFYFGGIGICVQDRVAGAVTGSVNPASGAVLRHMTIVRSHYATGSGDAPCPRCVGDPTSNDGAALGTCASGARAGLACDGNASIAAWPDSGTTSLDCPPTFAPALAVTTHAMTGTTATSSLTLSAASPSCTQGGYTTRKCACDTCNNGSASACSGNADCPVSDGQPGVCGGLRCIGGSESGLPCRTCYGGSNAGATCLTASTCPGGTCVRLSCASGGACTRAGELTQPSSCHDDTATPADETLCSDTGVVGDHVGSCPAGPIVLHCSASSGHPQRECLSDVDCCDDPFSGCTADPPTPGECGSAAYASCYLDNGIVGNSITAEGAADVPGGTIATPVIAHAYCAPPTSTFALNVVSGLPGPARLTLLERMRFRP